MKKFIERLGFVLLMAAFLFCGFMMLYGIFTFIKDVF